METGAVHGAGPLHLGHVPECGAKEWREPPGPCLMPSTCAGASCQSSWARITPAGSRGEGSGQGQAGKGIPGISAPALHRKSGAKQHMRCWHLQLLLLL